MIIWQLCDPVNPLNSMETFLSSPSRHGLSNSMLISCSIHRPSLLTLTPSDFSRCFRLRFFSSVSTDANDDDPSSSQPQSYKRDRECFWGTRWLHSWLLLAEEDSTSASCSWFWAVSVWRYLDFCHFVRGASQVCHSGDLVRTIATSVVASLISMPLALF